MKSIRLALPFAIVLTAGAALAQAPVSTTVGALLDQGAKKLSAEEVKAVLSGATVIVPRDAGSFTQFTFKRDGAISGGFTNSDGRWSGFGTWKMDDDGKYCIDIRWNAGFMKPVATCTYMFKLGERHFISVSDQDRGATANERTYKR